MELTGSQIVIECLKEQGVDTVFGYPGGTILNIYDELYRHPEIHHILTSHEQGAAHAADGYARATGKTGVCMATSGPGATNLVTGIATAYMDSTPMVAITCNVGKALLGKDSFQEIDIAGVAMPITKYSVIVKDITVLADTLRRAFTIAKSGRPGPVLVDITKDMARATDWCGVRSGKDYNKFEEMHLTPGKSTVVSAPLIKESPLCIECRVKEIMALGSHDMFIADVVNVRADTRNLNPETGKLELAETNPLVYVHGGYYELGEKIGKFGWSVEKKK